MAKLDVYDQIVTDYIPGRPFSNVKQLSKTSLRPLLSDLNKNMWNNGVVKVEGINLVGEPG